jgi:hypothetical protein
VDFHKYSLDRGVRRQLTAPHSPQQNDVVECRNASVVGTARSMLKAKGLPNWFWGKAVTMAVYLLNWSPTKSVDGMTPFEAWYGKKPAVHHLRTFGCIVYVKNTTPHLKKLEDRGRRIIFVGYERGNKAFRTYDPVTRCVHITRDVVFDEGAQWDWNSEEGGGADVAGSFTVEYMVVHGHGDLEQESAATPTSPPGTPMGMGITAWTPTAATTLQMSPPATPPEAGSTASTPSSTPAIQFASPPTVLGDELDANHDDDVPLRFRTVDDIVEPPSPSGYAVCYLGNEHLFAVSAEEPASLADAERQPCWWKPIEEELQSIEENQTWTLTELPQGRRAIGLKWVFKVKRHEHGAVVRHKVRLIIKGYAQRHGIDYNEVFAPVACMEVVRLLIALAAHEGWEVHHMDVKSVFLNGDLQEKVFVEQPPGFVKAGSEHQVFKLHKALYGLHQASIAWNQKLDESLESLGFKRSPSDHATYCRGAGGERLVLGVYVDDLVITGTSSSSI